ncbi:MAG: recombination regulator RecX [Micrococcales bacterium]|nr:recombination regulator RecX [Micrococcales bacterium]
MIAQETSSRKTSTHAVRGGRPALPATEVRDLPDAESDTGSGTGPDTAADPEQVARTVALRLLSTAPRSRAQLAQAIGRKGVPDDVTTTVLDRFAEVGLVDDDGYAQALVRTRHADRGQTGQALQAELRRRGLDDDTATAALAQITPENEEQTARRLVARKLAATAGLDPQVRVRRTLAALGRKGYPSGLVGRLVREQLAAEGVDGPGLDELD